MTKPRISVITPTWNRGDYLRKVWDSLEKQKYPEMEWLIGDDGSSDNTSEVLKSILDQANFSVKVIRSNMRVGKAKMDNELISLSHGEFILCCDSDDYLLPNTLRRLIEVWGQIPDQTRSEYIGLTSLCATEQGELQSRIPSQSGIFDTTWNKLDAEGINTDMLILFRADIIKNDRFLEVDFVITESSLWGKYFDMKTRFIPEVMKIMYRGTKNRISGSQKMEYCRGKAYGMAMSEKRKGGTSSSAAAARHLINFHRYCIHGDISIFHARKLWTGNRSLTSWLLFFFIGFTIAGVDKVRHKVIKTHLEFDRNIKQALIFRVGDPEADHISEDISARILIKK